MTMLASAPTPQPSGGSGGELFRGFSSLSSRVSLFADILICLRARILIRSSVLIAIWKLTDRLKDSGLDNLVAGVKNFLPAQKDLTVTRLVASLMDPGSASAQALKETDEYLHFDPKAARGRGGAAASAKTRQAFNEAIVFVVGGGGYVEFANLQEYAARTPTQPGAAGGQLAVGAGKKITYGATEILKPSEFVQALGNLAAMK